MCVFDSMESMVTELVSVVGPGVVSGPIVIVGQFVSEDGTAMVFSSCSFEFIVIILFVSEVCSSGVGVVSHDGTVFVFGSCWFCFAI